MVEYARLARSNGRVHSFQSSSFQDTYPKGTVHCCVLEEAGIYSDPLMFKKHTMKGCYIIVFGRVHSIQSSSLQETYHKGMVHHWVFGRMHSFQSSSFQETYHKGMVHHWFLEV